MFSFIPKLFGVGKPRPGRVLWGGLRIPHDLTPYHFMACGATGSGKSTVIRKLMRSFLPDVRTKALDTRALIYDAKTELFPDLLSLDLGHETIILNPFDRRCTAWDIAADIDTPAKAKELAAIVVPKDQSQNRYFYDASRMLLEIAAVSFIRLYPKRWSFRDLLLACSNIEDFKVLSDRAGTTNQSAVEDFLTADREAKSVRMTLTVENSAYYTIAAAWERARQAGKTFTIRDWVEGRGPQILLLGNSKEARTALATVNRLLIQRLQQLLLDHAKHDASTGRRSWVVLDEFPTLGKIPYLEELLTEGRSRGVCAVLGFQHIEHVRQYYQKLGEVMIAQCVNQAYFKVNDAEMGEWCARNFGRLVIFDYSEGYPRMEVNQQAATENDFMDLPRASEARGTKCIIRSSEEVLPEPREIILPPDSELINIGREGRFEPWDTPLVFEPWSAAEREALGLPERRPGAAGAGFPANPAQNIADILPERASDIL